jgi:hypothetical protein
VSNILLVEPDYRSKFPPLGLMRLSAYHKGRGDCVSFVRGCNQAVQGMRWHRIYVSSLYTWELPRTVKTIRYYLNSVQDPRDVFVGGVGATLYPEYIRENVPCTVIEGHLAKPGLLGAHTPAVAKLTPDYTILDGIDYAYRPSDAYFTRITHGCIRNCKFCAVPLLEKGFRYFRSLRPQIREVDSLYGPKQHLVILDNNVLAIPQVDRVLSDIVAAGFHAGAKRGGRLRTVDFNQGLDARLIAGRPALADGLARMCLNPVRLAFDFIGMKQSYVQAIQILAERGFVEFTNYMLFNFKDSPNDLYERLMVNAALNKRLGIRITGFPMRFIPMKDVQRGYVSDTWHWRYVRGVQCILHATRGLAGTDPEFVKAAFGATYEEFLEIIAMPDRYIIYRQHYRNDGAREWRRLYRRLSESEKHEFLEWLAALRLPQDRRKKCAEMRKFRRLIEHYYPDGAAVK